MKRTIIIFLFAIALIGIAVVQNAQKQRVISESRSESSQIASHAPYFSLSALDNQTYHFSEKRDKPLLLHFWTSWCDSCDAEISELVQLYEKFQDTFDFYAVNITAMDNVKRVQQFVDRHGLPFPILLDHHQQVADSYRVSVVPTSFIINQQGVIVQKLHQISFRQVAPLLDAIRRPESENPGVTIKKATNLSSGL